MTKGKIFDPKITKGPWEIDRDCNFDIESVGSITAELNHVTCEGDLSISEEDAKSVSAVPELLEVLKQARNLIKMEFNSSNMVTNISDGLYNLEKSIDKLDEIYGE